MLQGGQLAHRSINNSSGEGREVFRL